MANSVFCIAFNIEHATLIVDQLKTDGFDEKQISLIVANDIGAPPPPRRSNSRWANFAPAAETPAETPAVNGVASGGIIGSSLGLLAGIALLAIPGVGPFLAAGPLMALLTGAAAGAAVGGLAGSMVGLGLTEPVAKTFEGKISAGNVLVSVLCENTALEKKVKLVFQNAGATDITGTEAPVVPRGGAAPEIPNAEPPLLDMHERP